MSLYVGNLSSRIRRDDLERVFKRYGRCNVRIKDGYGFVVYDFPPNAEKALRALQKSYICGEPLTLTWSNKQPRAYRGFARANQSYERQHGRDSSRGPSYVTRQLDSNDRQHYRMEVESFDNGERFSSADMLNKEFAHQQNCIKDYIEEEFQDQGNRVESDLLVNDRWDEQFPEQPNENGRENQIEFDRYKPHQSYDRKSDDEYQQIACSGGPAPRISRENTRRDHIGEAMFNCQTDPKFQEGCYACGKVGHKMRNCPHGKASKRRFSRFDQKNDDDMTDRRGRGEDELERSQSRSWEKQRSSREASKRRKFKTSHGKHRELMMTGSSLEIKKYDESLEKEYGGKKRSRKETGSFKRHKPKKSRRSPLPSEYTMSRSRSTSRSSKHRPRSLSRAKSRSVSSRVQLVSSDSRSRERAHYSRSKSSRSKSRSRSPTSLSLSESIGPPLVSSSNKVQLNLKGSSHNVTTPESEEVLLEHVQPLEGDALLEDAKLQINEVNVENNLSSPNDRRAVEDFSLQKDGAGNQTTSLSLYEMSIPTSAEKGEQTIKESVGPEGLTEMDYQNCNALEMGHSPIAISKSDLEVPLSFCSGHSTRISSEELQMALKHYGLDLPDENEKQLSIEAYFGSARLWPWEIIYYRRLKKGPISIENYEKRKKQNEKFGIVDKYIRSSCSGWVELDQDSL